MLPISAELVSAGDFTQANGMLTANVSVAAGETKTVSYTVKATGTSGNKIASPKSTVGGVLHTCPAIVIAETLTADQQKALLAAVEQFKNSNPDRLVNFDLANAIYVAAGLAAPFSEENVHSSLFKTPLLSVRYELNRDSEYYSMVVPTMYGGRTYYTPQRYTANSKLNSDRSRLPREQGLVVGDLIVVKFSSSERLFMYTGEGNLLNLSSSALSDDTYSATVRLMRMMSAGNYYAILRPSMG